MNRPRLVAGLALALLVPMGGCSDPAIAEGQAEIAAELRAVRAALQADRAGSPMESTTPTPDDNRAALTAALAPMREVLVTLVRDVDEMRSRQTALTGELKRWSQLLAQVAAAPRGSGPEGGGGGADDAAIQQLLTRLGELETQMKSQNARHREVEGMIATALDRTSSRLEDFLQRMSALRPGGAAPADPANPNPNDTDPNPGNPGEAGKNQPSTGTPSTPSGGNPSGGSPAGGNASDGNQSQDNDNAVNEQAGGTVGFGPRPSPSFWWFGVAAVSLILSGMFALWLARENRAGATAQLEDDAAGEDGARELWAAAALLGEAVGRLRDRDGEPTGNEVAPSAFDAFAAQPTAGDPASDPMALLQQLAGQVGDSTADPPPRGDWPEELDTAAPDADRPDTGSTAPDDPTSEWFTNEPKTGALTDVTAEPVTTAGAEPAAWDPTPEPLESPLEPALESPADSPTPAPEPTPPIEIAAERRPGAAVSPADETAAPTPEQLTPAEPATMGETMGEPTLGMTQAPTAAPMQHDRPPTIELTLPATDPTAAAARAADALAQEPRVLRRPAFECMPGEDAVHVRYHVVPGTPEIERSRIEGHVRIAVH